MSVAAKLHDELLLQDIAPNADEFDLWFSWESDDAEGGDLDLDLSAMMLTARGKMGVDEQLIYYNNLASPCGGVRHLGDDQAHDGEAAEEVMRVRLSAVPADIENLIFSVTVPDEDIPHKTMQRIKKAQVKLFDVNHYAEPLLTYEITAQGDEESFGWVVGNLARDEQGWMFRVVHDDLPEGLRTLMNHFMPGW
ncbi:TerD family protein [Magnetofaba australis]|uniref:Putative stress protein n=1 Tax=Magnetofaba australis IT-1 TaxID=1434232 RepID=A0A1Y2K5G2_9PROT|nr:TerD family protein [Magnetofaba australis]OSM02235.1 putative stress protein [Magnetofaba australis IT-1]